MMKLCGHTMGTPLMGVFQALEFFARLGYEGIEIRCAPDGQIDPETIDPFRVEMIAAAAARTGIKIVCLTPYYRDFSTPEATEASVEGIRRVCQIAEQLECRYVRVLGGTWPLPGYTREQLWERAVLGLQQAADVAIQHRVRLALENHAGTLAQTAEESAAMIAAVNRPNFGLLLDYFWIVAARGPKPQPAEIRLQELREDIRLLAPHIFHCHCKGLQWEATGQPRASFVDEGEIDWLAVIRVLHEHGYQGYLSDEYEKYWRPELPEPEEGMARNAAYLRHCLAYLQEAARAARK